MKVLIGCEESQAVCIEFRKRGHEAFSCDVIECSGGHPEWHLQMDVFEAIKLKNWDLGIFFPPCTRLTVTANKWYKPEFAGRFPNIHREREEAVEFFMALANAPIERIAIENPIGIMSTRWRKPDQIIHPYYFGDDSRKATCLWLKNLPPLQYALTDNLFMKRTATAPAIVYHANGKTDSRWHFDSRRMPKEERSRFRSKTFPGIARAMAEQWSCYCPVKCDCESPDTNPALISEECPIHNLYPRPSANCRVHREC